MKKTVCLILIFILTTTYLSFAAEETQTQDDKGQEFEKTKELEKIAAPKPVVERFVIKYGGWFSSTMRKYKNTDNDNSDTDNLKRSWEQDIRLWLWMTYLNKYTAYLRIRDTNIDRITGSGYTGIGNDNEGPYLDMGYLAGPLEMGNIKIDTKLGRQFFSIGRGISFNGVHDGIELGFKPRDFYIKTMFAHSNPKDDNIDQSVPEYDKKEDRLYLGAETSWLRFYPNIFYLYGVIQRDRQNNHPAGTTQRYQYHSQYLGLGVDKQTEQGFSYWGEAIKEWGRDFMDTTYVSPQRSRIEAWAINLGTRYLFKTPTRPSLELEYALASGDPDRTSVTDTKSGGNRFGKDNNFSYYGYFGTGYAFAGRLSNLELLKIQAGFTPFPENKFGKNIDLGAKFFLYRKDRAEGRIYDTDATEASNDVGKEFNLFLYWEPNKNFYMNVRFGIFYPGAAFPETTNDNTKYFLTRATLKF